MGSKSKSSPPGEKKKAGGSRVQHQHCEHTGLGQLCSTPKTQSSPRVGAAGTVTGQDIHLPSCLPKNPSIPVIRTCLRVFSCLLRAAPRGALGLPQLCGSAWCPQEARAAGIAAPEMGMREKHLPPCFSINFCSLLLLRGQEVPRPTWECSHGTLEIGALLPPVTPGCSCWFPSLYKPIQALQSLTCDPAQLPGLHGNGFPRQGMLLSALEFSESLVSRQIPITPSSPGSLAVPCSHRSAAASVSPSLRWTIPLSSLK